MGGKSVLGCKTIKTLITANFVLFQGRYIQINATLFKFYSNIVFNSTPDLFTVFWTLNSSYFKFIQCMDGCCGAPEKIC